MNNMIFMQNVLLIKESNEISLMTLTVLPALQHNLLDMLFQCCFFGWNVFNWVVLLYKQELVALIHRNTWTSNIAQENNKLLETLKIFITNTGNHRQSKKHVYYRFHCKSKIKFCVKTSIYFRLMHVS